MYNNNKSYCQAYEVGVGMWGEAVEQKLNQNFFYSIRSSCFKIFALTVNLSRVLVLFGFSSRF